MPDTVVEDKLETVGSPQDVPDQQLEQPLQNLADPLVTDSCPPLTPALNPMLDRYIEDIDIQEFCVNCLRGPEGVTLRKCTRCTLSFYCSVKCQRENWRDHKVACSLVAAHIAKGCD